MRILMRLRRHFFLLWHGSEILLIETKHAIGSLDSQIKATVEHKTYGKALMIHWKDWSDPKRRTAMTVTYDPRSDKNVLDAVFRCSATPTY